MAVQDLARALRNPGRLVLNPTTFGATPTFPYGGTEIGLVKEVELSWGIRYHRVISEDFNECSETQKSGEVPELAFTLEQWDTDLIPLAFPKVNTGASPSLIANMMRIEGAGGTGPQIVAAMNPILFAPFDSKNNAVLFLRPVPEIQKTQALALAMKDDSVIPVVFVATRTSNQHSYYVDKLEHLSLT